MAYYLTSLHPFLIAITICLVFLSLHFSPIQGKTDVGFSINLIRKTSLQVFPHRLRGSSAISRTPQAPVSAYLGQYLVEISIGTPPFKVYGIADTGSDLIWTQCVPCNGCYKQLNPMFDPKKSSSYSNISCDSKLCHELGVCSPQKQCNYTYAYGGGAMTQGVLAQETVTLTSTTGTTVPLRSIVFGCGHNESDGFNDHEMGIIGLGGGPASLISQTGSSFGGKMFSQCLVPFHTDVSVSSKMTFGKASKVSGGGVVSTPLVAKDDKTLYFVTLLGISVGKRYLPYNGSSKNVEKGNMFLDSGTPPTLLPAQLYDRVVAEVKNQVAMKPIVGDPDLDSQLCYRTKNNLDGPMLTAHFEGANVTLGPIQTFIPPKDGVFCLAFTNTTSDVGIYGNYVQSNYLIGFDLEAHMVSFKPTDCTKHT